MVAERNLVHSPEFSVFIKMEKGAGWGAVEPWAVGGIVGEVSKMRRWTGGEGGRRRVGEGERVTEEANGKGICRRERTAEEVAAEGGLQ